MAQLDRSIEKMRRSRSTQGHDVVELLNREGIVVATVVGDNKADLTMAALSFFQHLNEALSCEEYFIQERKTFDGDIRWSIYWNVSTAFPYRLGDVISKEDADRVLIHLCAPVDQE